VNKKIIGISIAMLFSANGAFAQSTNGSSVELYGILDVAVGTVHRSLSASPYSAGTINPGSVSTSSKVVNNSVTGMFNGGLSGSRWGIRGSEDLGGGLKAIFTLESALNVPTGNIANGALSLASNPTVNSVPPGTSVPSGTASGSSSLNGQLFGRQAFVGLSHKSLGQVTFGRNYAPIYDIAVAYDPLQAAQLLSPIGYSGALGGGGGVTENSRQDNSIKYKNKIADFNFGAMYKLGGVAGNHSAGSAYGLFAGYEANGFGIQGAYQGYKDALSESLASTAGSINVNHVDTTAYMIAAKYAFGGATIRGGFESYTLKKPSNSLASLGVTSINGFTIGNASAADFKGSDRKTDLMFIGGDYNFTPEFNLAAGFYNVSAKSSAAANGVAGQVSGKSYHYSVLADYRFTKRTDVYAGAMFSQFKGDANVNNNSSNRILAVGMRTKF